MLLRSMLVSVIIPAFNRAGTIPRALDSVLAQTWKPMELIVVDDGSTDRTGEIVKTYGDNVRLIRQSNQGPSAARNAGINAATGEIISFLDSDDSWLPEKTERQVRLLQRNKSAGVKCCVCNARLISGSQGETTSFKLADLDPDPQEGIWENPAQVMVTRFLLFNQVVAVWRDALEETGYFRQELRIMEDYDLALRFSLTGPWAFIREPLVVWHGGAENSLSRAASELDKCTRAFEILSHLKSSSRWGRLLPEKLLHRRMRHLRQRISALDWSVAPFRFEGLLGKLLLLAFRARDGVNRRRRSYPRMIARAA